MRSSTIVELTRATAIDNTIAFQHPLLRALGTPTQTFGARQAITERQPELQPPNWAEG